MAETEDANVMSLTVTLLSAYFANNTVPSAELPALVDGTRRALLGDAPVATPGGAQADEKVASKTPVTVPVIEERVSEGPVIEGVVPDTPAAAPQYMPKISIEESLASPDHILSLIDGKPYKALKRHLSAHGLTPAEYRDRYGLPADYPIVAPGYSASRREVALKLGLGGKRKSADAPVAEEVPAPTVAEVPEAVVADTPPAKPAPARRPRSNIVDAKSKPAAKKSKRKAAPAPVATHAPAPQGSEAPSAAETPPAEPVTESPSPKAIDAKPKSVTAKPKRKGTKDAAPKASVARADVAQKPKRIRAKRTGTEAVPPTEPAPETTPAAG